MTDESKALMGLEHWRDRAREQLTIKRDELARLLLGFAADADAEAVRINRMPDYHPYQSDLFEHPQLAAALKSYAAARDHLGVLMKIEAPE